jgi:hypothetical protein
VRQRRGQAARQEKRVPQKEQWESFSFMAIALSVIMRGPENYCTFRSVLPVVRKYQNNGLYICGENTLMRKNATIAVLLPKLPHTLIAPFLHTLTAGYVDGRNALGGKLAYSVYKSLFYLLAPWLQ